MCERHPDHGIQAVVSFAIKVSLFAPLARLFLARLLDALRARVERALVLADSLG